MQDVSAKRDAAESDLDVDQHQDSDKQGQERPPGLDTEHALPTPAAGLRPLARLPLGLLLPETPDGPLLDQFLQPCRETMKVIGRVFSVT